MRNQNSNTIQSTVNCQMSVVAAKSRAGQSLVEVLIAISIGSLIIGVAVGAISLTLKSDVRNVSVSFAIPLAKDLVDKTRSISQGSWASLYNQPKATNLFIVSDGFLKIIPGTEGLIGDDIQNGLIGHWKFDEGGGQSGNLVTNGDGSSGNNTNFSGFAYDSTDSYDPETGMFKVTSGSTTKTSDALIPVDPTKEYRVSYAIKLLDDNGQPGVWRHYGGVVPFDRRGSRIENSHVNQVSGSARTTLAADLNPNDTTITLTDSTNWHDGSTGHMRSINFYPYIDPNGFTYEDYGYSRLVKNDMWAADDSTGNTGINGKVITLKTPWNGPAYPAGTKVANAQSGGTYMYTAAGNKVTPTSWGVDEGTITGPASLGTAPSNRFWNGTASVTMLWLLNRGGSGSATTAFDAISFERLESESVSTNDAYDSSPGGNKGALLSSSGGPVRIDSSGCKISSCVRFDGVDDYVSIPSNPSLNVTRVTIAAWVKPTTTSGTKEILHRGNNVYGIRMSGASAGMIIRAGSVTQNLFGGSLVAGTLHHIVGTYDGTTMRLYVDSVEVNSAVHTGGGNIQGSVGAFIGSSNSGSNFWNGLIDDIRIYNRALSAEEVKQLHDSKIYTRAIVVENVNRTGCGRGEISSNPSAATCTTGGEVLDDPSTQKITATINFAGGNPVQTTQYLTRLRNEVTRITDWSDADSFDGANTNGIDINTPGEIKLFE